MKIPKNLIIIVLLALPVGLVAGLMAGNKPHSSITSNNNTAAAATTSDLSVDINSDGLKPDTVTLKVGQTLQINAKDGKTHNFSLGEGGEEHSHSGPFSSGDFQDGEAWKVTFKQAGTYQFHDHNDPRINLLVVAY